ncbi:unnamed protein product [Closterium sp. NIES-53]
MTSLCSRNGSGDGGGGSSGSRPAALRVAPCCSQCAAPCCPHRPGRAAPPDTIRPSARATAIAGGGAARSAGGAARSAGGVGA